MSIPFDLSNTTTRVLTCAGVVAAGTVGAAILPAGVAVAFGTAAAGIAGNLLATDIDQEVRSRLNASEVLRNHDLERLCGEAIKVVIIKATEGSDPLLEKHKSSINKFAEKVPTEWSNILKSPSWKIELEQSDIKAIPSFLLSLDDHESHVRTMTALNPELWQKTLAAIRDEIRPKLPDKCLEKLAKYLYQEYPIAVRELLKRDELGFRALELMFMKTMLDRLPHIQQPDQNADVNALRKDIRKFEAAAEKTKLLWYQKHAEWLQKINEASSKRDDDLIDRIEKGFHSVNLSLQKVEQHLSTIAKDVRDVKAFVAQSHDEQLDAIAKMQRKIEDRSDALSDSIKSALASQVHGLIRPVSYRSRLNEYAARCPKLMERDAALQTISSFARSKQKYLLITGSPWCGKTALVTYFSTNPPLDVEIIAFVISNRDGETRLMQFFRAVCDQLAAFIAELPPNNCDAAAFNDLWQRASKVVANRKISLVLVVDGLDENNFLELGEPSIASQLPIIVPPFMHIVVTSRSRFDFSSELPESHPLSTCETYELNPLEHGVATLKQARKEVYDSLLKSDSRKILGTLAVARGRLSASDLQQILSISTICIRQLIDNKLSRSLTSDSESAARPADTAHGLSHELLIQAVLQDLDLNEIEEINFLLEAWAAHWNSLGWPDNTPTYLLESYTSMLAAKHDGIRISKLLSLQRFELLRRRTGGSQVGYTELLDASRLIAADAVCDLLMLANTAFLKQDIEEDTLGIPPEYVHALARTGRLEEAIQLGRILLDTYDRVDSLLGIAESVADHQPRLAMALADEASKVPFQLEDKQIVNSIRSSCILQKCGDEQAIAAVRSTIGQLLELDEPDYLQYDVLYPLSQLDADYTKEVLQQMVDKWPELKNDFYKDNPGAIFRIGAEDALVGCLKSEPTKYRLSEIVGVCDELFSIGGRSEIPASLQNLLFRELNLFTFSRDYKLDPLVVKALKFIDYQRAEPFLKILIEELASTNERVDRSIGPVLASHGFDLRNFLVGGEEDTDIIISWSSSAATQCQHYHLAIELANAILDPGVRAARLAKIVAKEQIREVDRENVLDSIIVSSRQVPRKNKILILSGFASAAADMGENALANRALSVAVNSLPKFIDIDCDYIAQQVAVSAVQLGKVDIAFDIAKRCTFWSGMESTLLAAADSLHKKQNRKLDLEQLTDPLIYDFKESDSEGGKSIRSQAVELRVEAGLVEETLHVLDEKADLSRRSILRLLIASGRDTRAESMIEEAFLVGGVENAAQLVVELADRGGYSEAQALMAKLVQRMDFLSEIKDGPWPYAMFAIGCKVTNLSKAYKSIMETSKVYRLVTGTGNGGWSAPVEAVVRLDLWERYLRDANQLQPVIRDSCLAELAEHLLKDGKINEAIQVIDCIQEYPEVLYAEAADYLLSSDLGRCRALVVKSLAKSACWQIVRPLIHVEPLAIQTLAKHLGIGETNTVG